MKSAHKYEQIPGSESTLFQRSQKHGKQSSTKNYYGNNYGNEYQHDYEFDHNYDYEYNYDYDYNNDYDNDYAGGNGEYYENIKNGNVKHSDQMSYYAQSTAPSLAPTMLTSDGYLMPPPVPSVFSAYPQSVFGLSAANQILAELEVNDTKSQGRLAELDRLAASSPDIEPRNKKQRQNKRSGTEKSIKVQTPIPQHIMIGAIVGGVSLLLILICVGVIMYQQSLLTLAKNSRSKYIKKPRIAVVQASYVKKEPWSILKQHYNSEISYWSMNSVASLKNKDYHVVVAQHITDELLQNLPSTVVAVISSEAHENKSVIRELSMRHVQLSYGAESELRDNSTADTHIFLMLSAMRNYRESVERFVKAYENSKKFGPVFETVGDVYKRVPDQKHTGFLPNGKTLGILGMNGVGRAIALRAKGFGFKRMVYFDETKLSRFAERSLGLQYVPFEELISTSNVISLNAKWGTPKFVNGKLISKMPDSVVLVSTGPEDLLDYSAVSKYLKKRKIWALGTDSLDINDKSALKLLINPNVVVTPRTHHKTQEVMFGDDEWVVKNIRNLLETGVLQNLVPEQEHFAEDWVLHRLAMPKKKGESPYYLDAS